MRWMVLIMLLVACTGNQATRLALANPASVNCTDHGGRLVIRQTSAGAKGYCMLTDGRTLDAWEYYRQTNP